jgi:hypothetical protein
MLQLMLGAGKLAESFPQLVPALFDLKRKVFYAYASVASINNKK